MRYDKYSDLLLIWTIIQFPQKTQQFQITHFNYITQCKKLDFYISALLSNIFKKVCYARLNKK